MRRALIGFSLVSALLLGTGHMEVLASEPIATPKVIARVNHRVLTVDDLQSLQPGDPKIEGRSYTPIPARDRAHWALFAEKARQLELDKTPDVARELANGEDQRLALVLSAEGKANSLPAVSEEALMSFLMTHSTAPHFPNEATPERQRAWARTGVLADRARAQGLDRRPDVLHSLSLRADRALTMALLKKEEPFLEQQAKVSEAEVRAYYDAHPEAFQTAATVTYRRLSVFLNPTGSVKVARTEAEALARIAVAQAALKAGIPFAEAVKQFSDDPLRAQGGLHKQLSLTSLGPTSPSLPALRDQPVGIVSAPFRDIRPDAICLILVEARTPSGITPYEEARQAAGTRALSEKRDRVIQAYLEGLKKEMSFELFEASKDMPGKP